MARKNVIVIKNMNAYNHATAPFGPKDVVAVISDARDVGVQLYANDNGSMYFTLPVDHPALPLIDPLRQHYLVQRWDGSQYVDIQGGILTDYDAGENEVVISGVDYMTTVGKYYTPLPGPKLGQKAIPNTDETQLSVIDSSKYTANAFSTGKSVEGRAYGSRARNFPISGATMTGVSGTATSYANLLVEPLPSTSAKTFTPKAIIENAVKMDKEIHYHSSQASVAETNDSNNGDIRVYSGAPASGTTPLGKENEITVDYEEVGGVRTGNITISGSIFIFRGTGIGAVSTVADLPYTFYDPCTGMNVGQDPVVKQVGMIVYANPGGALFVLAEPVSYSGSATDLGTSANPLQFSFKLRPINKYDAATEQVYGLQGRVHSLLTEGVSYSFAVRPYYIGGVDIYDINSDITPTYYENYFWGDVSKYSDTGVTSGLKSNTLPNIYSSTFTEIMDRSKDYANLKLSVTSASYVRLGGSGNDGETTVVLPKVADATLYVGDTVTLTDTTNTSINGATSHVVSTISSDRKTIVLTSTDVSTSSQSATGGYLNKTNTPLVPLIKFTSLNQINTATSSTIHAYATAGQSPIDFFRELSEIEIGTRTDGSKTVFNFYGVPGATATGNQLIVNHNVSGTPQTTLVYPGQIKGYSVVARRSLKTNSVRVIPTTDFLLGSSTEGAVNGVKSQGIIKNPSYSVADPALPVVVTQGGFIAADSAGNYGQGLVNDSGTDADVTDIRVQLRSEVFGPIGMAGTPKLGETVNVVINRKSSVVGGDMIVEKYNVGGMEWLASVDGHEELYLDLVKPEKFVGPGINWERKPAPSSKSNPKFRADKDKKPIKEKDGPGNRDGDNGFTGEVSYTSWWGPGGKNNIGGLNDMYNIQEGRGGAYNHYLYMNRVYINSGGTSYMWPRGGTGGGSKKPKGSKGGVGLIGGGGLIKQ
jgi:hypothetical protein